MWEYVKDMAGLVVGLIVFFAVMWIIGIVMTSGQPKKEAPPKDVPLQVETNEDKP